MTRGWWWSEKRIIHFKGILLMLVYPLLQFPLPLFMSTNLHPSLLSWSQLVICLDGWKTLIQTLCFWKIQIPKQTCYPGSRDLLKMSQLRWSLNLNFLEQTSYSLGTKVWDGDPASNICPQGYWPLGYATFCFRFQCLWWGKRPNFLPSCLHLCFWRGTYFCETFKDDLEPDWEYSSYSSGWSS